MAADIAAVPPGRRWYQHPLGFWFIALSVILERSAFYGIRTLFVPYTPDELLFSSTIANSVLSLFLAVHFVAAVPGGWASDKLGRFWLMVGVMACYAGAAFGIQYGETFVFSCSLTIVAIASGALKPIGSTLMGETYTKHRPNEDSLRKLGFALYYAAMNIGSAFAIIFFSIKWWNTYDVYLAVIPLLALMSLVVFAAGKKIMPPSPRTDLLRVLPKDPFEYYSE